MTSHFLIDSPRIAFPKNGAIRVFVKKRQKALEKEVDRLKKLVADILVGEYDGETLEVLVNKSLSDIGKTLSLAESCTGGNISKLITSVPGASKILKGSLVAYNEDIKITNWR